MAQHSVVVSGRDVPLRPGDSAERMERVARYVESAIKSCSTRAAAHGRQPDDMGLMLESALELGDELFMAQDENTRLRRDISGVREHVFDLERTNDELNRKISVMQRRLEELELKLNPPEIKPVNENEYHED